MGKVFFFLPYGIHRHTYGEITKHLISESVVGTIKSDVLQISMVQFLS